MAAEIKKLTIQIGEREIDLTTQEAANGLYRRFYVLSSATGLRSRKVVYKVNFERFLI